LIFARKFADFNEKKRKIKILKRKKNFNFCEKKENFNSEREFEKKKQISDLERK